MTREEIEFFDRISETWDEEEVLSTPSKIKEILDVIHVEEAMTILDLGTGTGVLLPYLAEIVGVDGRIMAVDISEGMLSKARKKYGQISQVEFLLLDFEQERISGEFDLILLYCVYPHLHFPKETLNRLLRENLSNRGRIVIAFPTDENFINNIHKEKKAESDMLPSAHDLAMRLREWGMKARVVSSSTDRYIVEITR